MKVKIPRGPKPSDDERLCDIVGAVQRYLDENPKSSADVYRYGEFLVRIRVVDPSFKSLSRGERHQKVWDYLETLPEDTLSDVSYLLTLAPGDRDLPAANREFDDPLPARI